MTHLPFVAATYALGVLIPLGFALDAWRRLARARLGDARGDARADARGDAR